MFGRSRRVLRAEIRHLEERLDVSKRETLAARGDCGLATRDAETWERRATRFADHIVDVEVKLRDCRRQLAAYEREAARIAALEAANEAAYRVVLDRPVRALRRVALAPKALAS